MAEELHVLFGGGQVGHPLSRILLGCGKRVRIVKRSASGLPEGVELVRGDATDPNFCVEAARGESTVYKCINPPYYARVWAELESNGQMIGAHDVILAATALERGDAVATFNVRHFAAVPGLTVITPSAG